MHENWRWSAVSEIPKSVCLTPTPMSLRSHFLPCSDVWCEHYWSTWPLSIFALLPHFPHRSVAVNTLLSLSAFDHILIFRTFSFLCFSWPLGDHQDFMWELESSSKVNSAWPQKTFLKMTPYRRVDRRQSLQTAKDSSFNPSHMVGFALGT